MSLELLDAHETAEGLAVTFGTERGIERLEGSHDEIARLAKAMQQVAALGQVNEDDDVWVDAVSVGDALVKLGVAPHGQTRVLIIRSAVRTADR
ncbi:MAG TPA: hypothetical protein VMF57_16430 [Solirubrobacteraceae bacterium]|nr:hypothetical protein [Solirubrobacteraceae bacterium]